MFYKSSSASRFLILAVIAAVLSACNTAPPARMAEVDRFLSLLSGTYEGEDEKNVTRVSALVLTDGIPGIDGAPVYWQIDTSDRDTPYRQRLLTFRSPEAGVIIQDALTPKDPASLVDLHLSLTQASRLTKDQFEPTLSTDCEQRWTRIENGWKAYVDPATCRFYSERRQAYRQIESETVLTRDELKMAERGFDDDGNQVFGSAPNTYLVLKRID